MLNTVKNQKGFGHVGIILVIVVIALVGFSGWFVWNKNKTSQNSASENTSFTKPIEDEEQPKPVEKLKWLTYRNEEGGLTYDYPETWSDQVEVVYSPHPGQERDFWAIEGKITSPGGNAIELHYWYVGGKGGDCEPDVGDTAFGIGNKCASKQILDATKLPSVAATQNIPKNLFGRGDLYITKTKYRPASAGDITYNICLDTYAHDEIPLKSDGLSMGLMFRCQYWDTGLNMTYSVKTKAELYSGEAKIVEQIMKSVKPL